MVCEDRMQGMLQMEKWVADGRELLQLVRLYYSIAGNLVNGVDLILNLLFADCTLSTLLGKCTSLLICGKLNWTSL